MSYKIRKFVPKPKRYTRKGSVAIGGGSRSWDKQIDGPRGTEGADRFIES